MILLAIADNQSQNKRKLDAGEHRFQADIMKVNEFGAEPHAFTWCEYFSCAYLLRYTGHTRCHQSADRNQSKIPHLTNTNIARWNGFCFSFLLHSC